MMEFLITTQQSWYQVDRLTCQGKRKYVKQIFMICGTKELRFGGVRLCRDCFASAVGIPVRTMYRYIKENAEDSGGLKPDRIENTGRIRIMFVCRRHSFRFVRSPPRRISSSGRSTSDNDIRWTGRRKATEQNENDSSGISQNRR